MKKKLIVYVDNHFDLLWRRCFRRKMTHDGKTYVSYADIQSYYILENLKLAKAHPEYTFQVESVYVLKVFLEDYPEYKDELLELCRAGRFRVPGSGFCITDSNLVGGESLCRNYLLGNRWLEDTLGYRPQLCVRNDAFGNSAQLPQILKNAGFKWVTGLSYRFCTSDYWKGLDGTAIYQKTLPVVGSYGGWYKYAPCPRCSGEGYRGHEKCPACAGRGIDYNKTEKNRSAFFIDDAAFGDSEAGFLHVGGEEILPTELLFSHLDEYKDHYDISFGFEESAYPYLEKEIAHSYNPGVLASDKDGDLNPASTGCYVSRIEAKQNVRRLEKRMQAVEALSSMVFRAQNKAYVKELGTVWEDMFFTMFHDCVTGPHVDQANAELRGCYERIDASLDDLTARMLDALPLAENDSAYSVLNPLMHSYSGCVEVDIPKGSGFDGAAELRRIPVGEDTDRVTLMVNDIAPLCPLPLKLEERQSTEPVEIISLRQASDSGGKQGAILNTVQAGERREENSGETHIIENSRYKVTADRYGLLEIFDKSLKKPVSAPGIYRPCEFVLEHDEGSPWATLYPPSLEATGLSAYTSLIEITKSKHMQTMVFEVAVPMHLCTAINSVDLQYEVRLIEGLHRVEFFARVEWSNFNHRLRVAFPCPSKGEHMYEIPYGYLQRDEYEPEYAWPGKNGDWPAAQWAGVDCPDYSVAVFNRGTPSYCIKDEVRGSAIYLSLLRSPTTPTYLHEPYSYRMNDWDGMRDEGSHSFEFALASYSEGFLQNSCVLDAECYNAIALVVQGALTLPEMPVVKSENIRASSVKVSEDGRGLIVRLVEYKGRPGEAVLELPEGCRAQIVDGMEEGKDALAVKDGRACIALKPFEITAVAVLTQGSTRSQPR